jgi:tRNA G18 (ribose-2'-O)-methylase SpoU
MPTPTRLIFGFHSTLAKLRHSPQAIREIYVDSGRSDARLRDLLAHADFAKVRVLPVEHARLQAMAPGARHQGVIASVDATQQQVMLDDVLDTLDEPPSCSSSTASRIRTISAPACASPMPSAHTPSLPRRTAPSA